MRKRAWACRLGALLIAFVALAWLLSRPAAPDAFYEPPAALPTQPGRLLKQEAFLHEAVPPGASAWRILYTSPRGDGRMAVASAVLVARPSAGPRALIAWAHGTSGLARGCAPALMGRPFDKLPALPRLLEQGWALLAPDYPGLGTAGPHPYLIGESEGRAMLDAIRAAQQLPELKLNGQAVVWGHSQGGHAALWTGLLAPRYAPELKLAGIAALAPASDLPRLVEAIHNKPVGRILSAYLLAAYGAAYADVWPEDELSAWAAPLAADMAGRCLGGWPSLLSVGQALLAGGSVFKNEAPASGPFGARLASNTPEGEIAAPLLVAQGLADELVPAAVQHTYVSRRCAQGQGLDYWRVADRDHLSLLAHDSALEPALLHWTRERLAGAPPAETCRTRDL